MKRGKDVATHVVIINQVHQHHGVHALLNNLQLRRAAIVQTLPLAAPQGKRLVLPNVKRLGVQQGCFGSDTISPLPSRPRLVFSRAHGIPEAGHMSKGGIYVRREENDIDAEKTYRFQLIKALAFSVAHVVAQF